MKFRYLHVPFYFGMSLLLMGALFKIMHWGGGNLQLVCGLVLETTFFILAMVEILSSLQVRRKVKLAWGFSFLFLPVLALACLFWLPFISSVFVFLLGSVYLGLGRNKFVPRRKKMENITFDSFTIENHSKK